MVEQKFDPPASTFDLRPKDRQTARRFDDSRPLKIAQDTLLIIRLRFDIITFRFSPKKEH